MSGLAAVASQRTQELAMGGDLGFRHVAVERNDGLRRKLGHIGLRAPQQKRVRLLKQKRLLQFPLALLLIFAALTLLKFLYELPRRQKEAGLQGIVNVPQIK